MIDRISSRFRRSAGRGGRSDRSPSGKVIAETGERWEAPFNFHTGPGCSYTWNLERNGKLEVIYSHSSFAKPMGTYGLPYQAIKRAVFNLKKEKRS